MNETEAFEKIKSIIVEQLGVDENKITQKLSFKDIGADSLKIIEFIMELEERFEIEIPDEDAERMKTVGDAVRHILERKNV